MDRDVGRTPRSRHSDKEEAPSPRNAPKNWDRRCSCILVAVARDALAVASFLVSLEVHPTSPLLLYIQPIAIIQTAYVLQSIFLISFVPFQILLSLDKSAGDIATDDIMQDHVNDMTYTGRDKSLARMTRFQESLAGVRNTSPGRRRRDVVYRICHKYHSPSNMARPRS